MKGEPESPASLYWVVEDFVRLRAYFRTVRAVKSGVPLWDWSRQEREEAGYLGPWTFNLYESVLASLPANLFLGLLVPLLPEPARMFDSTDPLVIRIGQQVFGFMTSLYVPLTLLALSGLAARLIAFRASKDRTERARLTATYLYFDGLTGFVGQMLLSLVAVFMVLLLNGFAGEDIQYTLPFLYARRPGLEAIPFIAFGLILFSAAYSSLWAVPTAMLRATGRTRWLSDRSSKRPGMLAPYVRYMAGMLVGGGCLSLVVALLTFALAAIIAWASVAMIRVIVPAGPG